MQWLSFSQQKIPGSVKKWKVPGIRCITTVKQQIKKKHVNEDHGELQTQSPQRLDDWYKHTSGRNDRWPMRLKAIEAEYYYIEN